MGGGNNFHRTQSCTRYVMCYARGMLGKHIMPHIRYIGLHSPRVTDKLEGRSSDFLIWDAYMETSLLHSCISSGLHRSNYSTTGPRD